MKRNVSINSLLIAIALLLILVVFIGETIRSSNYSFSLQTFDKGSALPAFSLPQLFDPEKSLTENDLKGQVCLLNFWASWCKACFNEQKTLLLISKKYHIPIFGITYKDNAENAKTWLESNGNPYGVIGSNPTGDVATLFEVFGVPITFIIDKHGIVRYRYMGTLAITSWETEILPLIEKLEQAINLPISDNFLNHRVQKSTL